MNRRLFCASLSGAVLALCIADPAVARRKFRFRPGIRGHSSGKSYGPEVLTQSQLKECLVAQDAIDAVEDDLAGRDGELEKARLDLEARGREIDDARATVDRYSKADVDNFNAMIDSHETARVSFNAGIDARNGLAEDLNQKVDAFNARCGSKSYYEDDMAAARRALGL